jgi:steroid delta-isomerase-like uncharacterized protein
MNMKRLTLALVLALTVTATSARADDLAALLDITAAWTSHDANAVAALYSENGVNTDVAQNSFQSHGRAEIRQLAQFYFNAVPDLRLDFVNGSLKGGHGTLEYVLSGTDVGLFGTRQFFKVRGVLVVEVEGTKIVSTTDYYDLATILKQLHLMTPALAGAAGR